MDLKDFFTCIGLLLTICTQVYYIYNNHPEIYEQNYHIIIIVVAIAAIYLLLTYFKRKIDHVSKSNKLLSPAEYEAMKKEQTKKKLDQLLNSQEWKKLQMKKQKPVQQEVKEAQKQQENISDEQFIQELEQKEKQIFHNQ